MGSKLSRIRGAGWSAALALALLLAACEGAPGTRGEPAAAATPTPAPGPPAAPPLVTLPGTPAPVPPQVEPAACAAAGRKPTLDDYKTSVACHLLARSPHWLFEGAPPPMLRSVVVLAIRVDERGRPNRVSVMRSNGIRELEQRAVQTVHEAAPLPAPASRLLRNGSLEVIETWLFRDDGRFQLRTLAQAQAGSAP